MINIVTALACEANPIIRRYGLKKSPACLSFPLYESDSLNLIVSGMGTFASASAVGFLQSLSQCATDKTPLAAVPDVWLNVGIAGHRTMDIGTALLAHKVSAAGAEKYFFPCFTFQVPCATGEVITVDKAETQYHADAAYDMEALGFCVAASRFSSVELIHSLKVVSDNLSVSPQGISRHVGEQLVANQLPLLDALIDEFHKLQATSAKMYALPEDYRFLTEQYYFTVTQQNQLKNLLRRWRVLINSPVDKELDIDNVKNAKQLLAVIEARLRPIVFTC